MRCVAIVILITSGFCQAAAPTTQYVCHRAGSDIQLDGKLDDDAWQRAEWTNDFADITGDPTRPPKHRSRAKMIWNDSHLFIAAEFVEPNVSADMKDHDASLFKENAFEIFIDPDGDGGDYAEIQVNALGTVMELVMDKTYRERGKPDMSWDAPGMKFAVHVDGTLNDAKDQDRGWSAEASIPFTALKQLGVQGTPSAGKQWRLNLSRVYRETKDATASYWTWSPQGEVNMHVPSKWGVLQFEK